MLFYSYVAIVFVGRYLYKSSIINCCFVTFLPLGNNDSSNGDLVFYISFGAGAILIISIIFGFVVWWFRSEYSICV